MAPSASKSKPSKKVETEIIPKDVAGHETRLKSFSKKSNNSTKSIELQQLLLNIFKTAFVARINDELPPTIQQVKQHLYNREFDLAFKNEAFLEAYAIRWSPSRALAYLDILNNLPHLSTNLYPHNNEIAPKIDLTIQSENAIASSVGPKNIAIEAKSSSHQQASDKATGDSKSDDIRIVCMGGGAGAEMVALAGYFHHAASLARDNLSLGHRDQSAPGAHFDITAIDIADWSNTIKKTYAGLTTDPPLSRYASASAREVNVPLVDAGQFKVHFLQQDILQLPTAAEQMQTLLPKNVKLVTLMFTLNELYSTSISATTTMLLSLTATIPPGALFLIVDSPGSYSTINIGSPASSSSQTPPTPSQSPKNYPMQWLLDHTLLESASIIIPSSPSSSQNPAQENKKQETKKHKQWEKLYSNDSRWFRLDPELTYPVGLEDVRCQVHLFLRL